MIVCNCIQWFRVLRLGPIIHRSFNKWADQPARALNSKVKEETQHLHESKQRQQTFERNEIAYSLFENSIRPKLGIEKRSNKVTCVSYFSRLLHFDRFIPSCIRQL